MKTYGHLTGEERAQIEILHKAGEGPTDIGRRIGRAKSTVSVELRRLGTAESYTAKEAMDQATRRAAVPRRLTVITDALREKIRKLLARGWSPEQIAGRWPAITNSNTGPGRIRLLDFSRDQKLVLICGGFKFQAERG